jgi:hypothetical protein
MKARQMMVMAVAVQAVSGSGFSGANLMPVRGRRCRCRQVRAQRAGNADMDRL